MSQARSSNCFPESFVVKIWQRQLLDKTNLVTEEGEPIKIIYPGRINDDRGADLRDAVIATRQGLIKGDVEIHVKSSGWRAHRHYQDPRYNRVILHVVFWCDTKTVTNLQNGESILTLALHKYVKNPIYPLPTPIHLPTKLVTPCQKVIAHLTTDLIGEFMDSAGHDRFLVKAARFQAELAQTEASQALYQGIMGALGYAKNTLPFQELARRLPLQILESITLGKTPDTECLARQQALLLGTAGLLPSQRSNCYPVRDNDWIDKLERIWVSHYQPASMSENDWHLFKVRPNNFPTRRILAMSYLILRYNKRGILEELINRLKEAAVNTDYRDLEKALLVTPGSYRASHSGSGLASGLSMLTLLGNRRAADIVVNVLLPFVFAWGKLTSQPEITQKALDLYYRYPRLTVNTLERHMKHQIVLSSTLVNSARRQQGLIHIYKTLCSQGKCHRCLINHGATSQFPFYA